MPDMEKVISRLDKVSRYFKSMLKVGFDGDKDIYVEHRESVKMAIFLLKEQQEQIEQMNFIYGFVYGGQVKEIKELVRCKDCKHYRATPGYCAYDRIWQENKGHVWGMYCKPDWFCADGELKE